MADSQSFRIIRFGNYWKAIQPDGWVLAEMTDANGVLNGSHDGTAAGRSAWDDLVAAISASPSTATASKG